MPKLLNTSDLEILYQAQIKLNSIKLADLKQKYLDEGFLEPWAERKAINEYKDIVNGFMPSNVPVGYDMGPLD